MKKKKMHRYATLFAVALIPTWPAQVTPLPIIQVQQLPPANVTGAILPKDNQNDLSHYKNGMNVFDDTVKPGTDMTLDDDAQVEAAQAQKAANGQEVYDRKQQQDWAGQEQTDPINQPAVQQQQEQQFNQQPASMP